MSKTILVVDDEEDVVEVLRMRLSKQGYQVEVACNGLEGLEFVKHHPVDLIILDIMMPMLDGMEVLRQLGYHRETRKIPVIMLTAKTGNVDVTQAREAGVKEYLTKPFDRDRLLAAVRKALRLPAKPAAG